MIEAVRSWRCSDCGKSFNGDVLKVRNCPECGEVSGEGLAGKVKVRAAASLALERLVDTVDSAIGDGREIVFKVSVKVGRGGSISVRYSDEGEWREGDLLTTHRE